MTIALLVMTDGRRECIARTIPGFLDAFDRPDYLSELWIHDDSGDPDYSGWLVDEFGPLGFRVHASPGRSGFGGAIRSAWEMLRRESGAQQIFHLEDDFVPTRTIPLAMMSLLLDTQPHLVQVALRRQPWNEHERLAGGIVEQHPDAYTEHTHGARTWLEHRLFFTTNPTVYRRSLIRNHEWPDGSQSEGRFSHHLLGDDRLRFGFYGARDSGEWVEHIGHQRTGTGY